jgi:multiple sugar transport system substrate-binding protein
MMAGRESRAGGRRMGRRRFLELGGVGLIGATMLGGGTLAGCGGGGGGGDGGEGSLTFAFNASGAEGLEELIRRFNRENEGGITVEWREMPATSTEYFDQMQSELQTGRSKIDVIAGDVIWPPQFAANGYLLDLSDRFTDGDKSRYLEGPVSAVEYDGKTWGVPWFTDAGMFFYRKDLLEKSGFSEPPETWDEMKEMAEKVRADSRTKFGYAFQGSPDEGGVVDALEHVWNAGGDVLDGDRVIIDSPEAVEGLELRRSMISDGVAPVASGDWTTQESQASFTNGDVVFMRNWPFTYALLSDPEASTVRPEQVGVASIPVSRSGNKSFSGLGGWNFMVNATSEDKIDAAWAFIEYMTAPEQQKFWSLSGSFLPTLKSLYDDPEVLEKVPVADLGREAVENARPRPISPYYSDMSLEMADQFNAAVKGEVSSEQALEELQSSLQKIVDQA